MPHPMRIALALVFVALSSEPALAQEAVSPTGPEPAAAPAPEPPRYHLFRPTPREEMRELSTDRPDATESPLSVDAGHVQVESDVIAWHRDDVGDPGYDLLRVATSNVRIGVSPRADFQIVLQPLVHARTRLPDGTVDRVTGFGDTTLRTKVNLIGNDGGPVAVGLLPFLALPTASNAALRAERVEFGVDVPFGFDLPQDFALGGQVQFSAVDGETHRYIPELFATLTVGHAIVGELSAFVELATTMSYEGTTHANFELHGGLTLGIGPDIQLDLGVFGTVAGEGDGLLMFLGSTFRR